jgi:hypothetical protein
VACAPCMAAPDDGLCWLVSKPHLDADWLLPSRISKPVTGGALAPNAVLRPDRTFPLFPPQEGRSGPALVLTSQSRILGQCVRAGKYSPVTDEHGEVQESSS